MEWLLGVSKWISLWHLPMSSHDKWKLYPRNGGNINELEFWVEDDTPQGFLNQISSAERKIRLSVIAAYLFGFLGVKGI